MEKMAFLVKQAQRGNHEAFIQLISGYEKVLYITAQRLLGNKQDVADVMQETILICYREIGKLKNPKYFNTWVYKILVNNCKKFFRDMTCVQLDDYDEPILYSPERLELNELIEQIPETYRFPLILYYYNDLSIKEISDVLEIPAGTVKSRLARGRHILEARYKE